MDLGEIKKADLREYVREKYGRVCNSSGMILCPFHDDRKPSLHFYQTKGGSWGFKCHGAGCGKGGSIIDFVMAMEGIDKKEAIARLLKEFEGPIKKIDPKNLAPAIKKDAKDPSAKKAALKDAHDLENAKLKFNFDYKDPAGKVVYRKVKYVFEDGEKEYKLKHPAPGKPGLWDWTKGKADWIPYNLDKFKGNTEVVICEGEKDANTITRLKAGLLATSAPTGESKWHDVLTPHFKDFKKTYFLYDVGNEKSVQGHAQKLQTAFPKMEIFIVIVPLEKREADITDYLSTFKTQKLKRIALVDLLDKSEKFTADEIEGDRPHTAQTDLEKIVLARLIQRPKFLASKGLEVSLFSPGPLRRIFRAIEKLAKNNEKIDEILVSKEAGIKVNEALEIIGGIDQIPAENFKYHIQKLREAVHYKELFNEAEKQRSCFIKGAPVNLVKCEAILDELKKNGSKQERPKAYTLTEFLKQDYPERKTLIDPILGLQEITMIHGRPKIGKSLLSLQLARCLATGADWFGFKTYKLDRPILIIQNEISGGLMQERARASLGDMTDKDKIIIPEQSRNIFLNEESGQDYMSCLLEDFKPGALILDCYEKFFPNLEMALKDPRPFFNFLREKTEAQNLSVTFIHHDAKFQEGKIGGLKSLGTITIAGSTDGNWNIDRILDVGLDPVEFNRTARLSFESRLWEPLRPVDIRINDKSSFDLVDIPKRVVDEWDIVEEIERAGGQIEFKELLKKYSSRKMLYKAKERALDQDLIDETELKTKGNPIILMLKRGG